MAEEPFEDAGAAIFRATGRALVLVLPPLFLLLGTWPSWPCIVLAATWALVGGFVWPVSRRSRGRAAPRR